MEQVQIKVFISTILFVMVLSISKCSVLLFLHQLADNALQRAGVMVIGTVVLIWTLAVMAGIVFECEMPRPWEIWTGKCIPMVSSGYKLPSRDSNNHQVAFLGHGNGRRHCHRHHSHHSLSAYDMDHATRLPSERSSNHHPIFTIPVSSIESSQHVTTANTIQSHSSIMHTPCLPPTRRHAWRLNVRVHSLLHNNAMPLHDRRHTLLFLGPETPHEPPHHSPPSQVPSYLQTLVWYHRRHYNRRHALRVIRFFRARL